ncbi:mucoidy inhibitor MuiA family protein [Pontiella sp.]|uniref:mucoidy inhibitor MuiA family protein n=3 Tax=Pontiella sp. TaxID=2837462 RepID=UPI00356A78D9
MVGFIAIAALAVSSQVTEVTVYNDRAQVARTAQVELGQGINKLVFADLPEAVDSRGIQVEGSGAATVLDVRFKTETFKEIPKEAWKELYEKQAHLEEGEKKELQKLERLKESKAFLKKITSKVTHTADKEDGAASLDPGSWESMLALHTTKSEEYDDGLLETERYLKEIRESLKKVKADIQHAGADSRKQRRIVEVDLEAATAGKAELKLSYIVRGPQWIPTYDVRVDTATRQMEVKYFALVRQNTGEDWADVALKLSTANPGLGGRHPEMEPWRISMFQPHGSKSMSKGIYGVPLSESVSMLNAYESGSVNRFDAPVAADLDFALPEMAERKTAVARQGASVVFEVKGESGIASDNVEHRVAVSSVVLPSVFRYSAIPKLDPHAYLKAKAVNDGAHPFLAGKANVFLDGDFVTTSQMELVAPEEEFWVFLGADESMKVEHKLIKKYQSKEGFTGKDVRHAFEYLLTVKNTHAVAEEMIVWDQLPISGTEGLKVKLLEPKYSKDTDSLKIDEEMRISWFRTLQPGEEWEIPFSFQVDAPKGMNINGLE